MKKFIEGIVLGLVFFYHLLVRNALLSIILFIGNTAIDVVSLICILCGRDASKAESAIGELLVNVVAAIPK